jgi:2-polyprenyl-3-methyl-5-hydroxy-6-metoxy-1,4-benzoquinol methylase
VRWASRATSYDWTTCTGGVPHRLAQQRIASGAASGGIVIRAAKRWRFPIVRHWAAAIHRRASILDLGCGHGFPISPALVESGFSVHGVDASPDLVSECQRRLPKAQARCEPVEASGFFGRRFDGVVAIGLVFLLNEEAQRQLIRQFCDALLAGGLFLCSSPTQAVSWAEALTGQQSWSLGSVAYSALMENCGFELLDGFTDEGGNHCYSARKPANPAG